MKNSRRNRANAAAKAEKRAQHDAHKRDGDLQHVDGYGPLTGEMRRALAEHFKGDA